MSFQTTRTQTIVNRNNILKQQLKSRLLFLKNYRFFGQEDIEIEKYASKTAVMLSQFLSFNRIESSVEKEFTNLQLVVKSTDSLQVCVYDFGYDCGGSMRWITHPIIQWQDQNRKIHAYNFSKNIACRFYKIHKLKSSVGNFYLLIGKERANTSTTQNIAYVIKIDGNKVFVDYKAFVNRSYIILPNIELSFDFQSQILKCESDYQQYPNFLLFMKNIPPTNDTTATKKLVEMFSNEYNHSEPICLHFNNGKFRRLAKCR